MYYFESILMFMSISMDYT